MDTSQLTPLTNMLDANLLPVVAIVGKPNVGKSTLFNRLTASRAALVSDFPGMTRDRQYGQATIDKQRFIVVDTGGMTESDEQIDKLITQQAWQAILEADKVLLVVDGRSGITTEDEAIVERLRPLNKAIFLVINKTEGFEPSLVIADFFRLGIGTPYPIAAAHNRGITPLLQALFPQKEEEQTSIDETLDTNEQNIRLALVGRPNVGKSTAHQSFSG